LFPLYLSVVANAMSCEEFPQTRTNSSQNNQTKYPHRAAKSPTPSVSLLVRTDIHLHTCLEVDGERFDLDGIRRLYESGEYPLARRATIP
jgi:hypothetical protein